MFQAVSIIKPQLGSRIVPRKGGELMDVLGRLRQLLDERGWTEYRLSKECGLAQSTIGNIYRRNTIPSLETIETICKGFGISVAQFFAENDFVELTPEVRELVTSWHALPSREREVILEMVKSLAEAKGEQAE